MGGQIYAPEYLRNQEDTQLHSVADMIEDQIERLEKLKAENMELQERVYKLENREYKNIESLADHLKEVLEENQQLRGLLREACGQLRYFDGNCSFLSKPEIRSIMEGEK